MKPAAHRVGSQEPTWRHAEGYTETEGDLACELSAGYDMPAFEWQRDVLDDWLARDAEGRLIHTSCGLMVPRQNGKNGCLEIREHYGLVILGESILHTTHEYQGAARAFARLKWRFGEKVRDPNAPYPELNRLVRKYTTAAGQMIIELKNGGRIEFRTRTREGGRGGTFDLIVMDEAQRLTDTQNAALSPLNSAAPKGSPQTIYTGTPPKMDNGALVFGRIHDRVRFDAPEGFCWTEWSASEPPSPDDADAWYRYNPSLGIVLDERALRADAIRMLPEEFAIEHYGYWPQEARATPISDQIWRAREAVSPKEGRFAYAVKFSPDRRTVALCGARKPEIGPTHVELIGVFPFEKAIRELEGWLLERQDRASMVVLDGITGAPTLEDRLLQGGYRRKVVVRPNGRQLLEATSRFYEAIRSGGMTHGPGEPLALSATGAVRRAIGKDGSWAFGSTPQADSTPIEAACWAWWAAETTKRDPTRRTVARW